MIEYFIDTAEVAVLDFRLDDAFLLWFEFDRHGLYHTPGRSSRQPHDPTTPIRAFTTVQNQLYSALVSPIQNESFQIVVEAAAFRLSVCAFATQAS